MKLFDKDRLLLAVANCGLLTEHIAKKHFKASISDLKELVNDGSLIKSSPLIIYSKPTVIYTLSELGKDYIRKLGCSIYKTDTTQLEHDYLILKVYSTLNIDTQDTWQNETRLKQIYKQPCCDAIFEYANKIIAVEIITPRYTKLSINQRLQFISDYCDDSIVLKTSDIKI